MRNYIERAERVQFKLWMSASLLEKIREIAAVNKVSANAMAVQLIHQSLFGKPRYRVKAPTLRVVNA